MKAGTVSLRSYGIGGALLHKRILLMTRQQSREREEDEEEREGTESVQRGLFPPEQRRGRGLMPQRERAGRPTQKLAGTHVDTVVHSGSMTLSPQASVRSKCQESPIRTRLMSPFRMLRDRSQSREKPAAVRTHVEAVVSSPPQHERRGQTEQRDRRSVSPNPFTWLCRDRHSRRKTV